METPERKWDEGRARGGQRGGRKVSDKQGCGEGHGDVEGKYKDMEQKDAKDKDTGKHMTGKHKEGKDMDSKHEEGKHEEDKQVKGKEVKSKQVEAKHEEGKDTEEAHGGQGPAGQARDEQAPAGQAFEEQAPAGQARDEQAPAGQAREEQAPVGQEHEEQSPGGQAHEEQSPGGQAHEEQAPEGLAREEQALGGQTREEQASGGLGNTTATINMKGKYLPGVQNKAAKQRALLHEILLKISAVLVFAQEVPDCFEDDVIGKLKRAELSYQYVKTGEQAAIMWDDKIFELTSSTTMTLDNKVRTIRGKLLDTNPGVSDLLSRLAMVTLQFQSQTGEFLAVSYHGEHNKTTDKDKKKICKDLIVLVRKVCEEYGDSGQPLPYIVGGDFNFNTRSLKKVDTAVFSKYTLTPRGENSSKKGGYIPYKDNFLYDQHIEGSYRNVKVTDVTAFDIQQEISQEKWREIDVTDKKKLDALLDHDPVTGTLSLEQMDVHEQELGSLPPEGNLTGEMATSEEEGFRMGRRRRQNKQY